MPYRTDNPTAPTPDRDAFGHSDFSDALYEVVGTIASPAAVGLYSPWGSGKSTVLLGLRDRLVKKGSAFVLFDAWKFQENSLLREFLRVAWAQLERSKHIKDPAKKSAFLSELDEDSSQSGSGGVAYDLSQLQPVAIAWALGAVGFLVAWWFMAALDISSSTQTKVLVGLATTVFALVVGAANRIVQVTTVQRTVRRLDDPDTFARKFDDLLRTHLKAKELVVAIDNLDRCEPEQALRVLSTVRTFFLDRDDLPARTVFVVPVDDAALTDHVTTVRGEDSDVRSYLEKFFACELRIPALLDADMRSFTRTELDGLAAKHELVAADKSALAEIMSMALERNPRKVKQFINSLQARCEIYSARYAARRVSVPLDVLAIAKVLAIETLSMDEYEQLVERPERYAEQCEEVLTGRRKEDSSPLALLLRSTFHLGAHDLRPFLRLKQAAIELEVPTYEAMASGFERGDVARVEAAIAESDLPNAELTNAVQGLFSQRIQTGFPIAAGNIVAVLTKIDRVNFPGLLEDVVAKAAYHEPLHPLLMSAEHTPLIDALLVATGTAAQRVFARALADIAGDNEASAASKEFVAACAARISEFPKVSQTDLQMALMSQDFADEAIVDNILKSMPSLIEKRHRDLWVSLATGEGAFEDSEAAKYLSDTFATRADLIDESSGQQLVEKLVTRLEEVRGGSTSETQQMIWQHCGWIYSAPLPHGQIEHWVQRLWAVWQEVDADLKLAYFDLFNAFLADSPEGLLPDVVNAVWDDFSTRPDDEVVSWFDEELRLTTSGEFAERMQNLVAAFMSGERGSDANRATLEGNLERVDSEFLESVLTSTLEGLQRIANPAVTAHIVGRFGRVHAELNDLARVTESWSAANAANLIVELGEADVDVSEAALAAVAGASAKKLIASYDEKSRDALVEAFDSITLGKAIFDAIASDPDTRVDPEIASLVVPLLERGGSGTIGQWGEVLLPWATADIDGYFGVAKELVRASVGERTTWINRLILAERSAEGDPHRRMRLLQLVNVLVGSSAKLGKIRDERLADLKRSENEDDIAVLNGLGA